LGNVHIRFKLL